MKRILIIAADGLTKSGVPNVFMSIIKELHSKGYSFDVAYFDNENAYYKGIIESYGGKAIYCSIDEKKTSKFKKILVKANYKKLLRMVIEENGPYDCVHSFKGFESGYFLKAAKKLNIPVRIAHMTFLHKKSSSFFVNAIEKHEKHLTKKYASIIISDSNNTSENNLPDSKKRVVIRNIVDENIFPFNELDKNTQPISLVQIGSYCQNKNQLLSLDILRGLLERFPNSNLHLVGFRNPDDFSYFDTLNSRIANEELGGHVVLHEFDADLREIFKRSHYLLFPSHFESFGIVPVEAQMSGLFCFCSDTISKENNCGGCKYISISDSKLWVNEIIQHFDAFQGKHKRFDCSEFSKNNIIKKYEGIYNGK